MKRITMLLALMVVGVCCFATDGQWTEIESGYMVEYASGEQVWNAFYQMADGAKFLQEDTQLPVPWNMGFKIVVKMNNYSTMVWVCEGRFISIFVIERQ